MADLHSPFQNCSNETLQTLESNSCIWSPIPCLNSFPSHHASHAKRRPFSNPQARGKKDTHDAGQGEHGHNPRQRFPQEITTANQLPLRTKPFFPGSNLIYALNLGQYCCCQILVKYIAHRSGLKFDCTQK